MIAPDLSTIPTLLTAHPRWLLWREILRGGKPTKLPLTVRNKAASSTDPATWAPFAEIAALLRSQPARFHGPGVAFGDLGNGLHLGGIDLDSCLDADGNLAEWAKRFVALLMTYGEVSPSETGLKFFFLVTVADALAVREAFGLEEGAWGRKVSMGGNGAEHGPAVEVYLGPGRFFTVTGRQWLGADVEVKVLDRAALAAIAALLPPRPRTGEDSNGAGRDNSRSAIAWRKAARLRRQGKTYEEMCAALRADPETADWVREKGESGGERELKRLWDFCEPTEDAVAMAFAQTYANQLAYDHTEESWYRWQDGRWKRDGRSGGFHTVRLFTRAIRDKLEDPPASLTKIGFSGWVERAARADPLLALSHEVWNTDLWLLGTPGGVVNLRSGAMVPATPDLYISRHTTVTPAPEGTEAPVWQAFLDSATQGDKDFQGFLRRLAGYVLTGDVSEEVLTFFYGPGGNGKGTFLTALISILGDYAMSLPIEVFTAGSRMNLEYYRAQMAGARLVTASETEAQATWAEAQIKEITGNDVPVSGRHPRGRPFTFRVQAKVIIVGNHAPKLKGRSPAMERRLRVAPFTNMPAKPDLELKDKLKGEYPAILRWMIDGCLIWQRERLGSAQVIRAATSSYFEQQDAFGRWLDERCILDRTLGLRSGLLMADFNAWAKANGEDPLGNNAFAEMIDRQSGLKREKINGVRLVRGVGLKVREEELPLGR